MEKPKTKFNVGDLVEYSDHLPSAMYSKTVGVVVGIINFKEVWTELEEDDNPEYAKGFLEELKMYYALRDVEQNPETYPAERIEMLENMWRDPAFKEPEFLIKVVWTSGESYVEHPADLKIVLRVQEVPDEEEYSD